jgi:hypothetical protein
LLTPEAQASVDQSGPVGRYITNPLLHIAGAVPAGLSAIGAGIGQGITEAAGAVGQPALGRDINMLAQIAPVASMGAGVPVIARGVQEAPPTPRFVQEHFGEGTAENPLAAAPRGPTPAFIPPDANLPPHQPFVPEPAPSAPAFIPPNPLAATPEGVPTPNPLTAGTEGQAASVGAAASREGTPASEIDLTKRQELVNRAQAEQEKLNELQPGGRDLNRYVPGVDPTMAQMEQSTKTAREQKTLSTISPEISDLAEGVVKAHVEARKAYWDDQIAGSKPEVDALKLDRSDQAAIDTAAAFKPGQVANAEPVVTTISDILNAPRAKENTALQQYVAPIMKRLYEADGTTLKSDPAQLYGLREDLERMRSKPSQAKDQNLIHVSGELKDIRDALDKAIEGGAPGYRTYMDNYANASRRINELEVLQGHENGLNGFKTFVPYQAMMRKIVEAREKPGNNPYKSISDDTMAKLWNLRDDLRRAASADDKAKARGSDTMQNAIDVAKTVAKTGVRAAMHYGLYHATGDLGSNAILGLADMLNNQRLQAKTVRRAHEMQIPNPLHYPPPNTGP